MGDECLVSFADQNGRCFPSIRTFALHAGISKSAAQRDLADLVETEHVTRKRRPGGVYIYQIDRRFLPYWPKKWVSQLGPTNKRRRPVLPWTDLLEVSHSVGPKKNQEITRINKGMRARARDSLSQN